MLASLAVAAALVRCAAPGPELVPVGADGRIALADGTRVRVPDGLRPFTLPPTGDGAPISGLVDARGSTLVTISSVPAPSAELTCDSPAARERGLVSFRTGAQLPACLFSAADPGSGALALALVHAGEDVISVSVFAPAEERARRLAREVARSVEVAPVSRAARAREREAALLGCRTFDRITSGPALYSASETAFGNVVKVRCFGDDREFTDRTDVGVVTPSGSSMLHREGAGEWHIDGGQLVLDYDDGGQQRAAVEARADSMRLGDERWERRGE